MTDARRLESLLRACKDDPTNDDVRRVLADLLEDLGDTDRADFVRLQVDTPAEERGEWDAGRAERLARLARLLRRHVGDWLGGTFESLWWCPVPGAAAGTKLSVGFTRGLASVTVGEKPLQSLHEAWPAHLLPWLETVASGSLLSRKVWRDLCRGPYLEPFSDISIGGNDPDAGDVLALVERVRPRGLHLNHDDPGDELLAGLAAVSGYHPHRFLVGPSPGSLDGWAALTASDTLAEVRYLELRLFDAPQGLEPLAASAPLDNLRELLITGDHLTGLPELFASERLSRLTELMVSNYAGQGSPWLGSALAGSRSLRSLRWLSVSQPLSDADCAALAGGAVLQGVERLDLYGCGISLVGAGLLASPALANLTALDLSNNSLGDAGAVALARSPHLSRLRRLKLSMCHLGDAGLRALAASPFFANLEELDLSFNPFSDAGLEALAAAAAPRLRRLKINKVADGAGGWPALLAAPLLAGLASLDLGYSDIGPALGTALASRDLGGLRELHLARTGLGEAGVRALAEAPWLGDVVELTLRDNALGDAGVAGLLPRLTSSTLATLDLRSNGLASESGRALLAWAGLPHLYSLDLDEKGIGPKLRREIRATIQAGPE